MLRRLLSLMPVIAAMAVSPALAQEAAPAAPVLNSGDTAWMVVSSLLVIMMTTPGLALFYGGLVRKENVLATMMQTFATMCVVTITWVVIGYSLVFTEASSFIGSIDNIFLKNMTKDSLTGTIPESVFVMFQLTFAAITTALILGSVADRIRFPAMILFVTIWSIVVYAPVAHMVWGPGGLLFGKALDFAGGTVVHINAGIAGLVAAAVLGKREHKGKDTHNLAFSLIGASLLWVGWFGFNAGSALTAGGGAGMAMLNTQVAAAIATLAWLLCEKLRGSKPSVVGAVSGAVAGLVAITPAAGFVDLAGALAIGFAGGFVCFWATFLFKAKVPVDDSLDVFSVHCVGGIVGAILTGVFAKASVGGASGLIDGNAAQVWMQIQAVGLTLVYSGVMTFIILKFVRIFVRLRVKSDSELKGLDISLHGQTVL